MDMPQRELVVGYLERNNKGMIIKCGIFCLNILFAMMKMLPVQKKITYISRQMNTTPLDYKLVIENVKKKDPGYVHVVLAKTLPKPLLGKLGYCFHMLKQMYHIATSKAVLLDSYCIPVSLLKQRESLVVIQMWHALGAFKKFGYSILDQEEGSSSRIAELMRMHKNYTYALTSSEYALPFFAEAFQVEESQMRVFPLPKTDMLLDDNLKQDAVKRIYEAYPHLQNTEKKIIVYAPTFRKGAVEANALREAMLQLVDAVDFEKYELVIKTHDLTDVKVNCENVIVDHTFTSLEFFHVADVIITDYSAVLFEAVFADKPIYFYAFDFEEYMRKRSFYIDYYSEMPGTIEKDASKLLEAIEKEEADLEKIKNFREKMVASCKTSYTDDFVDFLLGTMRN